MFESDIWLFQNINQFAGRWPLLDSIALFLAEWLGYVLFFILFLFLFKNLKKYRRMIFLALASAIVSRFVIVEIIRFLWERPRPFVERSVNLILEHGAGGSFPSGHAAFFFGLSAVVYFYNKKLGILFLISSFFISIARVFAGVHWPSDVLAGAVAGIVIGFLAVKISKR